MEIVISPASVLKFIFTALSLYFFIVMAFSPMGDKDSTRKQKIICAIGFIASMIFIHTVNFNIKFVFQS